jgi:hypothetical protein
VARPLPGPRAKTVITSTSPMNLAGCRSRGRRTDRPRGCLLNHLCLVANGMLTKQSCVDHARIRTKRLTRSIRGLIGLTQNDSPSTSPEVLR